MKSLFLLAIVSLAVVAQVNKEVGEVRRAIKQFPGTTIIVLYDPGANQQRTQAMVDEVKQTIMQERGADQFQFFLTEINVDALKEKPEERKLDPERFLDELKINAVELKHAPTLVATRKGWAYWAHGDGAVQEVQKELKSFDAKARASNPHALKKKSTPAAATTTGK